MQAHEHEGLIPMKGEVMRTVMLTFALLAPVGVALPAIAAETSATMEKTKGEAKAMGEEAKGQTKGAVEDLK